MLEEVKVRKRDVVVTEDDDSWCEISPGVNCDEGGSSRSRARNWKKDVCTRD